MGIMDFLGGREVDETMARSNAPPLDAAKIDYYVIRLKAAVYDRTAFDSLYAALIADKGVSVGEMIEIARNFTHGVNSKSKKDAILAIGQERMRLAHAKSKAASAAKSKSW